MSKTERAIAEYLCRTYTCLLAETGCDCRPGKITFRRAREVAALAAPSPAPADRKSLIDAICLQLDMRDEREIIELNAQEIADIVLSQRRAPAAQPSPEPEEWSPAVTKAMQMFEEGLAKRRAAEPGAGGEWQPIMRELADDLEALIEHQYRNTLDWPSQRAKYERDMEPVKRAKALLAAAPQEGGDNA